MQISVRSAIGKIRRTHFQRKQPKSRASENRSCVPNYRHASPDAMGFVYWLLNAGQHRVRAFSQRKSHKLRCKCVT